MHRCFKTQMMEKTIFIEEEGSSDLLKATSYSDELFLTFYTDEGNQTYTLLPYQVKPLFDLMKEFLGQASMSGEFDKDVFDEAEEY